MSISSELDTWAADLATATGMSCTRDPDLIHPPCLFVSTPESMSAPLQGRILDIPVYAIAAGTGKQQLDDLLDALPTVLDATGQQTSALTSITIGDITFNAYQITVPVHITT